MKIKSKKKIKRKSKIRIKTESASRGSDPTLTLNLALNPLPTLNLHLALSLFAGISVMWGEATAAVAQGKQSRSIAPINVVTLNRREPVSYDKEIEPILADKCQVW